MHDDIHLIKAATQIVCDTVVGRMTVASESHSMEYFDKELFDAAANYLKQLFINEMPK